MTDERLFELVNLEIDGAISPQEEAELHRRVQGDPEAANLRAQIREISGKLDEIELEEPPAGFREEVVDRIRSNSGSITAVRPAPIPFAAEKRRRFFRYAWTLAAGLIVGLLLAPVLFNASAPAISPTDATGAMRAHLASQEWEVLDNRMIENGALEGSVEATRSGEIVAIELDLTLHQQAGIEIRYDASEFGLAGFSREDSFVDTLSLEPGLARIAADQRVEVTLFLVDLESPSPGIDIEIVSRNGEAVTEQIRLGDGDPTSENQLSTQ